MSVFWGANGVYLTSEWTCKFITMARRHGWQLPAHTFQVLFFFFLVTYYQSVQMLFNVLFADKFWVLIVSRFCVWIILEWWTGGYTTIYCVSSFPACVSFPLQLLKMQCVSFEKSPFYFHFGACKSLCLWNREMTRSSN